MSWFILGRVLIIVFLRCLSKVSWGGGSEMGFVGVVIGVVSASCCVEEDI
ncbi:hypothetical protein M758_12G151000 [Ceratodon purpureus]|nr:hypothetical protein M758_12G151000 [Ceratodon purpureus]